MKPDLKWLVGSTIENVVYDDNTQRWLFDMTGGASLWVECPWKVISNARVSLASGDHGQQ